MAFRLFTFWIILFTYIPYNDATHQTLFLATHLKSEIPDLVFSRNGNENVGHNLSYETMDLRTKRNIINDMDVEKMLSVFQMNDSSDLIHVTLAEGDVVVCLTRNRSALSPTRVYFSYDSGRTFEEIQSTKMPPPPSGHFTIISKVYSSPVRKSFFIFADVHNKCLFVTRDSGRSFQQHIIPFSPSLLKLHSLNENLILGSDKDDPLHKLWMSDDFGATWNEIQQGVKTFFWGIEGIDKADTFIVQRQEPGRNETTILLTNDFFHTQPVILFTGALDFEIIDKYMFVTKKQRLLGSHNPDGYTLQLWVSYNREAFQNALFPFSLPHMEYHIADASEDQVFACVVHDDQRTTHLYISEVKGVAFSLSLENILYLNLIPSTTSSKDTRTSSTTLVDLHKVVGLRGVYIATQVQAGNDLVSLITFDKGAHWDRLSPPTEDMDGNSLPPCNISSNCSLHVTQKLNQLFPYLRRTSNILSKKSAVGIIIASGVLGKSLKGHPNVYLSSDAGLHWHEVLRGNYLYTLGDFGGIIVAVQYFSPEAATDTLLYSTNEGETWESLQFLQDGSKVHVFGLMTIPGEATTIFTIFGSQPTNHSWIWIRVDLRAAFKMICKKSDYKEWIPRGPHGSCLLGQKEVFERRLAHVPCYNGENYQRPTSIQPCPCRRDDYECDFGYEEEEITGNCVKEIGMISTQSIPSSCVPGKFYNLTKGYRKVSGDKCKEGLSFLYDPELTPCPIKEEAEFLMVTLRQRISRLDLNAKETVWESIPLALPINNVIAFDFDIANNCIYFADIVDDKIMRQCLNASASEILLSGPNYESVEGLALDWVSHNLYIVDGQKRSLSLLPVAGPLATRHPRILLNSSSLEKPRGIALHPSRGYVFLTDWGTIHPAVYRANLDGSNLTTLFNSSFVTWPNGITVDFADNRIFWADAKLDYIASANFEGHDLKYIIRDPKKVPHPFSVAIYKDWIYFDDWVRKEIIMAHKYTGLGLHIVASTEGRAMDIKVFSKGTLEAFNTCAGHNGCTHLCVGLPSGGHRCLCPGGVLAVPDANSNETCFCSPGHPMAPEGFCLKSPEESCKQNEFHCSSSPNKCIPLSWKCDHFSDCDDHRDETYGCENQCENNYFSCNNGQCIPANWQCDFDPDCADESDEKNCFHGTCKPTEFLCKNGRCISQNFLCDLDDDCKDGSDEENCQVTTSASSSNQTSSHCLPGYLPCGPNNSEQCVPSTWFCDGNHDCLNGWDEKNCSSASCSSLQFTCHSNGSLQCIFQSWQCDGANDCPDGSDELNCSIPSATSSTTSPHLSTSTLLPNCSQSPYWFTCPISKQCIPYHWVCDNVNDCSDHTDELVCGNLNSFNATTLIGHSTTPPPILQNCGRDQFRCISGECIWNSVVCDGQNDCALGEDEINCHGKSCNSTMYRCLHSFGCIPISDICDGKIDCGDGSDETDCFLQTNTTEPFVCSKSEFLCHSGDCVPLSSHCDMVEDCQDGSDEANCPGFHFVIRNLAYDIKSVTSHSFSINWDQPSSQSNLTFHYLPSVRSFGPKQQWINGSWTSALNYTFTNLTPATRYQFQVYTAVANSTKAIYPSSKMHVMTLAAAPNSPTNVTVRQNQNTVIVSWNKPKPSEAPISQHKIYISPPITPFVQKVPGYLAQATIRNFPFEIDANYTFWVTAVSETPGMAQESSPSNKAYLVYGASFGLITNFTAEVAPNNSIILHWEENSRKSAQIHYIIKYRIDHPYYLPLWKNIDGSSTTFILSNVCPGVNYTFKVLALYAKMSSLSDSVTVETPGKTLPLVKDISIKVKDTSVEITWTIPLDDRASHFAYEIVKLINSRIVKLGQINNSTQYTLIDLPSCQLISLGVRVRGAHNEEGPLSRFSAVHTGLDPQKTIPIEPHIKQISLSTITLFWKPPCPWLSLGYIIWVRDITLDKIHWMSLKPTLGNGTFISLNLTLEPGAHYEAAVGLTILPLKQAFPAHPFPFAKFSGPTLPVPSDLSISQNPNGTITLYWKKSSAVKDPNFRYSYKINIWENNQPTDHQPTHTFLSLSEILTIDAKPGIIYHFSVMLISHKGYVSQPSPIADFVMLPYPGELHPRDSAANLTTTISIGIATVVIISSLAAALVFYIIRHRRLQRAYHNFVNSHYDTRSGAATFHSQSPNLPVITQDLDEEDDSPMIRGFSDDEPLVIA